MEKTKNLSLADIVKHLKAGDSIKSTKHEKLHLWIEDDVVVGVDFEGSRVIGGCLVIDDDSLYISYKDGFKITKTGLYRTGLGKKAFVYRKDDDYNIWYFVVEGDSDKWKCCHRGYTAIGARSKNDIIEEWED